MWFLVAISVGAYSSGSGYKYNQVNQVSTHHSKVECQVAAEVVIQQLKDYSEVNDTNNKVRLICVHGDSK